MEYTNKEPRIILPHIEKPSVAAGRLRSAGGCAKAVSGFTKAPQTADAYNYEDCRYHWVGNGYGPVAYTYFADFSAMVSGAVCMEIRDPAGRTVASEEIPFTEDLQKTPVKRITREDQPYRFDTLTFAVKNEAGMESSARWQEDKTGGQTAEAAGRACVREEAPAGASCQSARPGRRNAGDERTGETGRGDVWEYPLMRLIWSLTSGCNLHCRNCAFRGLHQNMTDLDGPQIRRVAGDIIQLGVPDVCLSGGEVLTSPFWYETAETLSRAGIKVSLITNGTLIDRGIAADIRRAGAACVSVSIDDLPGQEGVVRGDGSYENALRGIKRLKEEGIPVSVVTTVNAFNIRRLHEMRDAFTECGADSWCLKPVLPIGGAGRSPELWLDGPDIRTVIDFCYSAISTEGLPVVPALSFEMHSEKGAAVLRHLYGEEARTDFRGGDAGIFSAQLHPDGSLVGICVCSPREAAGNVKERSLADIWRDKRSFKALREFDPDRLSGYCGVCDRRDTCKGGDLSVRLAFGGMNAENRLCAYRNSMLSGVSI